MLYCYLLAKRHHLERKSSSTLKNDVDTSFAANYISPFILKNASIDTIYSNRPIIEYIDWGLRARNAICRDVQTGGAALEVAYNLGAKIEFIILLKILFLIVSLL